MKILKQGEIEFLEKLEETIEDFYKVSHYIKSVTIEEGTSDDKSFFLDRITSNGSPFIFEVKPGKWIIIKIVLKDVIDEYQGEEIINKIMIIIIGMFMGGYEGIEAKYGDITKKLKSIGL